jgi:hypothetical protein
LRELIGCLIMPSEKDDVARIEANRRARGIEIPVKVIEVAGDEEPYYKLKQYSGNWEIVFAGQKANIGHKKALLIVDYLLKNPPPPAQPVHVCEIEAETRIIKPNDSGIFEIEDPETGEKITLGRKDRFQERNLSMDVTDSARKLWQIRKKYEAVMNDLSANEMERQEAVQCVEQIDEHLTKTVAVQSSNAVKAYDRVRKALGRFVKELNEFKDNQGQHNPVYLDFADHLEEFLIKPSTRYSKGRQSRTRAQVAQTFTYEPPEDVIWTD